MGLFRICADSHAAIMCLTLSVRPVCERAIFTCEMEDDAFVREHVLVIGQVLMREHILVREQVLARGQVLSREHVLVKKHILVIEHVLVREQALVRGQVLSREQVPVEKHILVREHVLVRGQVLAREHILVREHILGREQRAMLTCAMGVITLLVITLVYHIAIFREHILVREHILCHGHYYIIISHCHLHLRHRRGCMTPPRPPSFTNIKP